MNNAYDQRATFFDVANVIEEKCHARLVKK